jgi:hypothetical protein
MVLRRKNILLVQLSDIWQLVVIIVMLTYTQRLAVPTMMVQVAPTQCTALLLAKVT